MLTGNKGEWSEVYTFFKLLLDKKIIGANQNLEKIEAVFFPILKIIREENEVKTEYELQELNKVKVQQHDGGTVIVDNSALKSKIVQIFQAIKNSPKTFEVPIAEELLELYGIHALNAGNNRKEDLVLKVYDHTIGRDHEIGFSIKSKLGEPATLLNASGATNFIYKITNFDSSKIAEVNAIDTRSKIRDRLVAIRDAGGIFSFHDVNSNIFEKNLRKIDTVMPEIISQLLLGYYFGHGSTLAKLLNHLHDSEAQILNFNLSSEDLEFKIKALLYNAALGMVPASPWDGSLRAHGGVIIVREDGEIICFHLYNAEAFRDYLFNSTRLESPGSARHKYGAIYEENGELLIKLNLQIRFIK